MAVKTSWSAGEVLTAADLTDTFASKRSGGINLLYNGAMQVSQRGTSTTSITTAGYYTADRWYTGIANLGTWTQTIENDAPFAAAGMSKSLKILCTTADAAPAAGDSLAIVQLLEGQDCQRIRKGSASAQKLTVSFYVKSNVTGTYIVELVDGDNSRRVSASYTVSASATWEKKTITFPADTTGGLDNDNAASLTIRFWLAAGSDFTGGSPLQTAWGTATNTRATGQTNLGSATNNYWQVTGVQLEVGDVATGFEFKSYGQELRECQRYYYRTGAGNFILSGFCISTTVANVAAQFPVTMRTNPTALEQSGTAGDYLIRNRGGNVTCTGVPTFLYGSTNGAAITLTATGLTQGDGAIGYNLSSGYFAWSAEL